jgi:hypothetical protein
VEDEVECRRCGAIHPASKYGVTNRVNGKVYRRRICGRCKQANQTARRREIRAWVEGYKAARACSRCGFSDFRALDFHHRPGEEKRFNVGDAVRVGLGLAEIQAEVAKCDLVCANCHRIEHHRRID